MNKLDITQNILSSYINNITQSPAQRTNEWYELRKTTFGGSEISALLGNNPYKGLKSLIAEKIGFNTFHGNTATRWGTLFEYTTAKCTEYVLNIRDGIKETGSIEGIISRQRYSPDGLATVKLVNHHDKYEYYIILFEFKAPLGTLPNHKIPKHYQSQIQTGLLNIPISDYAIFVNNCYRRCALKDLKFNGIYDKCFHNGDYKKLANGLCNEIPYACGIICFYQTKENYNKTDEYFNYNSDDESCKWSYNKDFSDIDRNIFLNDDNTFIDFGNADLVITNRLFELLDYKRIQPVYSPITFNNSIINKLDFVNTHNLKKNINNSSSLDDAKQFIQQCINQCGNDKLLIGYLPWKLMRSDIILEERNTNWFNTIKEPVNNAITLLDEILKSSDPLQTFNDKFPPVELTDLSCCDDDIKELNEFMK